MRQVKVLLALALVLGSLSPVSAPAVTCTQAHTFVNGEVITATTLNANPLNFVSCFANIDRSNIGSNGIRASQIIPDSLPAAVFGGSFAYQFNNGLISNTFTLNGVTISATTGIEFILYATVNVALATQTPPLTSQGSPIGVAGTFNSPVLTGLRVHCDSAAIGGTNNTVQIYRAATGGGSYATIGSALSWTTAKDASVTFGAVALATADALELGISSVDGTPPQNCVFYAEGTQNA